MLILSEWELLKREKRSQFVLLIDPDKVSIYQMEQLAKMCQEQQLEQVFVGGSLLMKHHLDACIKAFKANCSAKVVLFPGNLNQVSAEADAILFLSLVSGRNPEYLIGQQVVAAPLLKQYQLEVIPTAYVLIDGGKPTAVSYMSNSSPIPYDKCDIALSTAWAAEYLGMRTLYFDAGSGAPKSISEQMIQKIAHHTKVPLIVGGGISTPEKVESLSKAGANLIVVGNAIEKDTSLLTEMCKAIFIHSEE